MTPPVLPVPHGPRTGLYILAECVRPSIPECGLVVEWGLRPIAVHASQRLTTDLNSFRNYRETTRNRPGAMIMSKSADIKKETKKKPTKTMKEKKAEKKTKKENKGSIE